MLSTSLSSAVTGLNQFQKLMDNVGNNIANSNTDGYKATRMSFADTFSRNIQGGYSEGGQTQIGTGVTTSSVTTSYGLGGATTTTSSEADLAIEGVGFFMVKDLNGNSFATRDGGFHIDPATHTLKNSQGFVVQGASLVSDGAGGTTATPGNVDLGDLTGMTSFKIQSNGTIDIHFQGGAIEKRGQVLLNSFQNPQKLERAGGNLYSNVDAAVGLPQLGAAESGSLGRILSGQKEGSNVDLTNEFVNMITAQRGFQANARVITTSDSLLEEVVNLKR